MNAPNQKKLVKKGDFIDYNIPAKGLAGTRFWPGMDCDDTGNNCKIGQSGGPASEGFTCPANIGCAPPIDSKFEGTFGCLASVPTSQCQGNPSSNPPGQPLPQTDGWDTSMVDGYTLPYRVNVNPVNGSCGTGPKNNVIDCSGLRLSQCPTKENLSTNGQFPNLASENLVLHYPQSTGSSTAAAPIGCYAPCSKLTSGQWQSIPNPPFTGTTYQPSSPQAQYYCCPTPPISPQACSGGPVVDTSYVKLIHTYCPQTYAYAYDDAIGNFSCPAGTKYEVTFYCPQ
ncbi:MAG TPA: thaumatin family protein [Thermoanaerobaculia bacterium]